MKIRPNELGVAQDAVVQGKPNDAERAQARKQEVVVAHPEEGRIALGLGKEIASEFDPQKMAEERRANFERIRALVAAGNYSIPSQGVAAKVKEEITMEILTANRAGAEVEEA